MGTTRITITTRYRSSTANQFSSDDSGGCVVKIAKLLIMIGILAAVTAFVFGSCQSMAQSFGAVKVAEQQTAQMQIKEQNQTARVYIHETEQTKRTQIIADRDMHISDNGVKTTMISEVWSKLAMGAVAGVLLIIVAGLIFGLAKALLRL